MITALNIILLSILGLLLGSFYNVVAIRLLKRESIAFPPSHCVHCYHKLAFADLVPVFSYLLLKGRCRYCSEKVSARYPLGELLTALSFVLMYKQLGFNPELAVGLFFVSILIIITQTDLQAMIIPNSIVLTGVIGAIGLRVWTHPLPLTNYLIAAFVGSGILLLVGLVSSWFLKKEAMGGGDIKLYVFIGLILGIKLTALSIFFASLFGLIFGLSLILTKRFEKQKEIPFGPYIALGSLFVYLWGERLIEWYLALLL